MSSFPPAVNCLHLLVCATDSHTSVSKAEADSGNGLLKLRSTQRCARLIRAVLNINQQQHLDYIQNTYTVNKYTYLLGLAAHLNLN